MAELVRTHDLGADPGAKSCEKASSTPPPPPAFQDQVANIH
jgi:hypothetical protein